VPQPHQEITQLRKAGQLDAAYAKGYELLKINPNDKYLAGAIGWVLYEKIKKLVNEAKQSKNNSTSNHLRNMLREYAKLRLIKPDLLFSRLLFQLLQFPNELKFLPKFMMWAGIDCFIHDDFQTQAGNNDNVFESQVEKAARKVAKVSRDLNPEDYPDFKDIQNFAVNLIDFAIEHANIQKPEWLHYHKALLLNQLGRTKEAKELLIPFVQQKRSDYWTWHALAKVVEISDPKLAFALCAKACSTCQDENFGVNVFEDLSRFALQQNNVQLARWSANQAFTIRCQNEWRVPQSLRNLLEADWYSQVENIPNPEKVIADIALGAEEVIWASFPSYEANYLGYFSDKNGKKKAKFGLFFDKKTQELVTRYNLLKELNLRIGDPVTITIDEAKEHPIIVLVKNRELGKPFDSVMLKTGLFRPAKQGDFGFVDDIFVPPVLANQLKEEETVSLAVVEKFDKKKNRWGLTAVIVLN